MRVTDYILDFLSAHGVRHVFGITGGFITPLFDSFMGRDDIQYICTQHEQAAAMAADGYARFAGLGCAISTSGPVATNLITGIGCSYFDSIPVICITGQVPTEEARGTSGVRQRGFQETDIVSIVRPITKYARHVHDPKDIQYAMEAALWNAQSGRPGPVLLDIPMDVQMADVNPYELMHFVPVPPARVNISRQVAEIVQLLTEAKRPVIIYGAGCRKSVPDLRKLIEKCGVPCLPSWAALDMIPHEHPQFVSQFGVYGARAGNLTVQNADLILAIGTRLDGRMTGNQGFAPNAIKVIVDIDIHEAAKCRPDITIIADAADFLHEILASDDLKSAGSWTWQRRINRWKENYPIVPSNQEIDSRAKIQPLHFVSALSDVLPNDAVIVADSGANLSWVQQAIHLNGKQRLFSAYGYSPMGYALPASIGAHYATGKPIIVLCGDGAMQMNIQELQTLVHYKIPVKVFILNNHSYGIIKQFQEELFEGRYNATDEAGGYSVPDFQRIAEAYGLTCSRMLNNSACTWMQQTVLDMPGPVICDVEIDPDARIFPKTRFGNPIHNQHPLLPDDELVENMKND